MFTPLNVVQRAIPNVQLELTDIVVKHISSYTANCGCKLFPLQTRTETPSVMTSPNVMYLKNGDKIVINCGDNRLILNPKLLKETCTTEVPYDIPSRFNDSCGSSQLDL